MESKEEGKEKQEEKRDDQAGKKWKREGTEDERMNQGSKVMTLPLSPIHPQTHSKEQEKECIGGEGGKWL